MQTVVEGMIKGLFGSLESRPFLEVILMSLLAPISVVLYRTPFLLFPPKKPLPNFILILHGYLAITLPFLLASSKETEKALFIFYIITVCMLAISIFIYCRSYTLNFYQRQLELMNSSCKPFLTNFRATLIIATCLEILGVDFDSYFHPRLAKSESYGITLMDIGVGSIILSSVLVASERIRHNNWKYQLKARFFASYPLLILGIGRCIIVKAFNYNEAVIEYGTHWNFFLSLAVVSFFTSAVRMNENLLFLIGLFLLIFYQYALEEFGLAKYILYAPRSNFFSHNREGILGCIGLVSLYFMTMKLGILIKKKRTRRDWTIFSIKLFFLGLSLWALNSHILEPIFNYSPSRRMTNLPYISYCLSMNIIMLSIFIFLDLLIPIGEMPIFDAVSNLRYSQLVVFGVANFLTGITNKYIGTKDKSFGQAIIIMFIYSWCFILAAILWKKIITKKHRQK